MLLFYGATACRFVLYPQIERSTRVVVAAITKINIYSSRSSNKIVVVSKKERTFLPSIGKSGGGSFGTRFTTSLIVAVMILVVGAAAAADSNYANASERKLQQQQEQSSSSSEETFANIPQLLSGRCSDSSSSEIVSSSKDCKNVRIQRPKSRKAETCTIKCVTTCIRGGLGSPGEGPFNIRRPLVVFKDGFRSRRYCLVECSDICNLIKDSEDDGP